MESKIIKKAPIMQDAATKMLYIDRALVYDLDTYTKIVFELIPKTFTTKLLSLLGFVQLSPIGYEISTPDKKIANFLSQKPGKDKITYSSIVMMPAGEVNLRIWIEDPKTPKKWVMKTYIDRLYS